MAYERKVASRKRYGMGKRDSEPATQPAYQTAKANATPRLGQKKRSPLQRFLGQSKKYGIDAPSYNVGRTRRMA